MLLDFPHPRFASTGKSTALKILAGKQKPNLGRYDDPPDWEEILVYFRGSELQNYFTKVRPSGRLAAPTPPFFFPIGVCVAARPTTTATTTHCLPLARAPPPPFFCHFLSFLFVTL